MKNQTKEENKCMKYIIEVFLECGMEISYLMEKKDSEIMPLLTALFAQKKIETADWYLKQIMAKISFSVEEQAKKYYENASSKKEVLNLFQNPNQLTIEMKDETLSNDLYETSMHLLCTEKILDTIIKEDKDQKEIKKYLQYKKEIETKGKELLYTKIQKEQQALQ